MLGYLVRFAGIAIALVMVFGLASACADDEQSGADDDDLRPITSTATAVPGLPEDIQETEIVIEDGEFQEDSLRAIAEQPVILTVINRDEETYTLVVDELITEREIPGASETEIEFNPPNTGEFNGRILGPDDDEIDSFFINVEGPGGT